MNKLKTFISGVIPTLLKLIQIGVFGQVSQNILLVICLYEIPGL
ncbi:uncharacterized membrane protein YqaE (UPF0057 family) [Epilithonimonas hungarica]|nr:hypothetical protein [Epilithonimonas hungarica]MDP9955996.1 uncharacterized membrane protein YqaE (UPF0057 family) [Epilithonimonas hungarica]